MCQRTRSSERRCRKADKKFCAEHIKVLIAPDLSGSISQLRLSHTRVKSYQTLEAFTGILRFLISGFNFHPRTGEMKSPSV